MSDIKKAAHDELADGWRRAFLETIEDRVGLPLLLSGGVDSASILAALLFLGERPVCYSFRLSGDVAPMDVQCSAKMCADWDLEHRIVELGRSEEQMLGDIEEIMRLLGTKQKSHIQCAQPVMHMARKIRADGYSEAFVGTGGVTLDDRTSSIIHRYYGEEDVRTYREAKLLDKDLFTGTGCMHQIARMHGVELFEPYSKEPLRTTALSIDHSEINKPRQKGLALRAFPGFWELGYWRQNSPMQVNCGVREWHDTLLSSPHNRRESKTVVGVYSDIWENLWKTGKSEPPKPFASSPANLDALGLSKAKPSSSSGPAS